MLATLSTVQIDRLPQVKYTRLYNNPSYSRILIGSRLWSIRGQTHDWRHHYKCFPSVFKSGGKFENFNNILHDWAKDKVQKSIVDALNRYEKHSLARRRKIKPFRFHKMTQKKCSSSLSRRLSETKPNKKLVFVGREPLRYLEFNKPNKQNVYKITLFKKFNFSQSQNNCWHTDWCQKWNIKTAS